MTKLSHSAASTYQACPTMYKHHYISRIRPNIVRSSLIFGASLDTGLNALLEKSGDPEAAFDKALQYTEVNGKGVYVPTYASLVYAAADLDLDLFIEADYHLLETFFENGSVERVEDVVGTVAALREKKKARGFDSLKLEEKKFFNLMHWISLRRKGMIMLQAYRKKVMPKLGRVLSVQEQISLENEDGDKITGVVDLVAEVAGHGVVILDNKSSASNYADDSVVTSAQLSLYAHAIGDKYDTRKAGYIVLNKNLIKNRTKTCSVCGHDGTGGRHKSCDNEIKGERCGGAWNETFNPDVFVQIIIDEIPEAVEELVIENMNNINESIKTGVFTKNLNTCQNHFGGPCPYIKLCYKGDMHGLVDLNKETKGE